LPALDVISGDFFRKGEQMTALETAAEKALSICMALKSDETLLVLADDTKQSIAGALYAVGRKLAAEAVLLTMPPRKVNGEEPPEAIAEIMGKYDVVICPTAKSLTHTHARRNACKMGARIATMPGITEDTMIRALNADYDIIAERTQRITEILTKGRIARITTAPGTNLTLPIQGISAISSTGLLREKGMGGNLPSGESYMMPEEGKSNGILVIDGSVASLGKISHEPIRVEIEDGLAVGFSGGAQAEQLYKNLSAFGQKGFNVAELGIGTNHAAIITGDILEDEKVMGTIHIAFGNNLSMGGACDVGIHLDGVVTGATVFIDDLKLMEDGRLLI
jgi:leucyl aminopeptidase (aminopeptidase T)